MEAFVSQIQGMTALAAANVLAVLDGKPAVTPAPGF